MPVSRSRSGKFNMLGKRKGPAIVYVIYTMKSGTKYWMKEFDDDKNTGWWTGDVTAAFMFSDEEEIVDFCEMFMRKRDYNIEQLL